MPGFAALGETALGVLPAALQNTSSVSPRYFSDRGFNTEGDENPADQPFAPRLDQALYLRQSIGAGETGFGGAAVQNSGELRLQNLDAELHSLVSGSRINGRLVRVLAGGVADPVKGRAKWRYREFREVFRGTAAEWRVSGNTVIVPLRDVLHKLDLPLVASRYAGTGGAEGGADLAGKGKPQAMGQYWQAPAPMIDTSNLILQVHDGQVQSVDAVEDRGVDIPLDTGVGTGGDVATYAALVAASVTSGQHATCLAEGLVKLGSTPDGLVAIDGKGAVIGGSYTNVTASIVQNMLTEIAGLDDQDLDLGAFSALATAQASAVGYWFGPDNEVSVRQAARIFLKGIAGFIHGTRDGLISVGRVTKPSGRAGQELHGRADHEGGAPPAPAGDQSGGVPGPVRVSVLPRDPGDRRQHERLRGPQGGSAARLARKRAGHRYRRPLRSPARENDVRPGALCLELGRGRRARSRRGALHGPALLPDHPRRPAVHARARRGEPLHGERAGSLRRAPGADRRHGRRRQGPDRHPRYLFLGAHGAQGALMATKHLLGYINLTDAAAATLTASSEVATCPVQNLQDAQLELPWKTAIGTTAPAITIDLGAVTTFRLVSLIATNFSAAATWRIRTADTEADLTASRTTIRAPASRPGRRTRRSRHAATSTRSTSSPADQANRWIRIDVTDSSLTRIQAGRLASWRRSRHVQLSAPARVRRGRRERQGPHGRREPLYPRAPGLAGPGRRSRPHEGGGVRLGVRY